MNETLNDYINDIKKERKYVDRKPYSHNIISYTLKIIAEKFGKIEANKVIRELGLTELGWEEEK
jgi:hypothetical protein